MSNIKYINGILFGIPFWDSEIGKLESQKRVLAGGNEAQYDYGCCLVYTAVVVGILKVQKREI